MVTIIIILSVIVVVLGFATYNLLKKYEKCEDLIKSYESYMLNLSDSIKFADNKIKEIDAKGSFESDDEVGFFFKEIKALQEILNDFKIN